jgi:hypothetical protein
VISFKLDFKIPFSDSEPQLLLRRQDQHDSVSEF